MISATPSREPATHHRVVVHEVEYSYPNGVNALGGVSLAVASGAIVGIVGPSGCGKSTLLHLVAGLAAPTAGRVIIDTPRDAERHPLSMVFQKDTLLPWLTVRKNVGFFFRLHRTSKSIVDQRVESLLDLAGLSDFASAYPYQLSGGMRRRVAFLSAVAPLPHVLLLDEPFSSLDEPTRIAIHQDVFSIIRELNMTTLLVTHDLAEAISLCDEVFILTKRPGTIAVRQEIPFGTSRNMLELRHTAEFLEMYGDLWANLSRQLT